MVVVVVVVVVGAVAGVVVRGNGGSSGSSGSFGQVIVFVYPTFLKLPTTSLCFLLFMLRSGGELVVRRLRFGTCTDTKLYIH